MKRIIFFLLILTLIIPQAAFAADLISNPFDEQDDVTYKLIDEQGKLLTSRGGRIYTDDEYITSDNQLYKVTSVDDAGQTATAKHMGPEPDLSLGEARQVAALLASARTDTSTEETETKDAAESDAKNVSDNKLICMYSTHSDESYEKGDGTSSKLKNAGIYDVGDELKKALEAKGVTVEYSKDTFHPHDAGAYRRSRQTAEELLKQRPAALLDLHRDGIPDPDEYEGKVDGEETSKVRLLVGRSNPNAAANRAFAKQVKAAADEQYPGLIKDIFVGKGNYNQELYPQALLLEFGTHTTEKDMAEKATGYMADVLDGVLFGGTAKAEDATGQTERSSAQNKASTSGIAWTVGIVIAAAALFGLVSTGTLGNWKEKVARGSSELTGGLIGKKPENDENKDK